MNTMPSSSPTAADFLTAVGADSDLTLRFLAATEGKHGAEAIRAIAAFAQTIGYNLSFEDVRLLRARQH